MSEGHMRAIAIVPVSPDRYCPYCRRLLVKMNENGTFDLSSKAAISMVAEMNPHDLPEENEVEGFLEAECLHRRCRLRGWWDEQPRQEKLLITAAAGILVISVILLAVGLAGWYAS